MFAKLAIPGCLQYQHGQGPGALISLMAPWVSTALAWTVVASFTSCFVLCGVACRFGARTACVQTARLGSMAGGAGVDFGSPLAFWFTATALPSACVLLGLLVFAFDRLTDVFAPRWTLLEQTTSPAGDEYTFLYCSCWQAHEMYLARPVAQTSYQSIYRALGVNDSEWPSWASVIRPAGVDPQKFIHFSPDGQVLVLSRENRCVLAFDPPSGECWADGSIEGLCPFVLLDENAPLEENDVAATRGQLQISLPAEAGVPCRSVLRRGKSHVNPAVRKLAAEWLPIWDERAKLAGPDPNRLYP